jgi:hypothetical protein
MKPLILFFLLISLGTYASAQNPSQRRNEIESYKIAYLTEKMDLSPEEAKVFWPIYKNWQNEQMALRKERSQKLISYRKIEEIENLSDAEVQTLLTNELNLKQRSLNIEKKYFNLLKARLPIKTVGKYYRAQETFKKELLTRFKGGRKGGD